MLVQYLSLQRQHVQQFLLNGHRCKYQQCKLSTPSRFVKFFLKIGLWLSSLLFLHNNGLVIDLRLLKPLFHATNRLYTGLYTCSIFKVFFGLDISEHFHRIHALTLSKQYQLITGPDGINEHIISTQNFYIIVFIR